MLRVLYPYIVMPQEPRIANLLRAQLGWEPVLWIAPSSQHEEVKRLFPSAYLQTIQDAFYGRPIEGLNTGNPHVPERRIMQELEVHIPAILDIMDYYGPPDAFLHAERRRFARDLLLQWNEIVSALQPDLVFFAEAPHAPHTYALYALCIEYGIPTVFFVPTAIPTFSVLKDRLPDPPLRIACEYAKHLESPVECTVHPEIAQAVRAQLRSDDFSHWYMEQQAIVGSGTDARDASLLNRATRVSEWRRYAQAVTVGLPARLRSRAEHLREQQRRLGETSEWILLKFPGLPLGNPAFTFGDYQEYMETSAERKAALEQAYLSLCSEAQIGEDEYVYHALHYQPERTTSADGGVFRDQFLVASMLHEALPEGWLLYVKEHPLQFAPHLHGDKGRTRDLYHDLAKLPNVRLIRPDLSSKQLALNARAVATVTGTIAWEGVLNRRPALHFGDAWYEGCPGTTKVMSVADAREALQAAQGGAVRTDSELNSYLQALTTGGCRVDLGGWHRGDSPLSDDELAQNKLEGLRWWMENRYPSRGL